MPCSEQRLEIVYFWRSTYSIEELICMILLLNSLIDSFGVWVKGIIVIRLDIVHSDGESVFPFLVL